MGPPFLFLQEEPTDPVRLLLLPVCLILATAIPTSAAHTIESTVHPDGISVTTHDSEPLP